MTIATGPVEPMLRFLRTAPEFTGARLRRLFGSMVAVGVVLAVTVYVFRVYNDGFFHNANIYDEAFFTWSGWCVLKGLVPYRDFLEYKPPVLFLTHALSLKLFGFEGLRFRYFFLYFPLGSVLALEIAMLTRRIGKLSILALALAFIHIWTSPKYHDTALSDSESVGLAYFVFGVAFLIARTRFRDWTNAIGTALLLCSALSKEPFAPCALATWICCFFMGARTSSFRVDAVRYLKYSALGAGLVALALCIYMVPTGALRAYITVVKQTAAAVRGGAGDYCVSQGRFHPTETAFTDLLEQWRLEREEYVNIATLGYFVPFAVASFVFIARRSVALFMTAVLACMAALWAPMASFCHWAHHYNMTLSGILFFFVVGLDTMGPPLAKRAVGAFVGLTFLSVVLVQMWPRFAKEMDVFGTRPDPADREPVPGVFLAVTKYTSGSAYIFTNGTPLLYVQTNRLSPVRESGFLDPNLSFYQGDTDEEKLSGIRAQLERNPPKIFVMDPEHGHMKTRTNQALMLPFLAAHKYQEISPHVWLRPDSDSE